MADNKFPTNVNEALALLYCEKHITSKTTPAQLKEMYLKAKKEITLVKGNRKETFIPQVF